MKLWWLAVLAIGLVGCGDLTSKLDTAGEAESSVATEVKQTLQAGDQTFYIEVASTPAQREQGLMFVESMPANQGMLFAWNTVAPRNFWMKNTLIPLDMIWLDAEKNIVDIQAAEPCKSDPCPIYSGKAPAQYVLELNQGVLRARVGDKVEF